MSKKEKSECSIDLLIEDLDGCGLIITDIDLIKERLKLIGFTYDSKTVVIRK